MTHTLLLLLSLSLFLNKLNISFKILIHNDNEPKVFQLPIKLMGIRIYVYNEVPNTESDQLMKTY